MKATKTIKSIKMDAFGRMSYNDLSSDKISIYFTVTSNKTGEVIDNMEEDITCEVWSNGEVYIFFGDNTYNIDDCVIRIMLARGSDDRERNILNKIPHESEWREYTLFRQLIFRYLKNRYNNCGTIYKPLDAWNRIKSTFTELNTKGYNANDITMTRLEKFLNELSTDIPEFFISLAKILRTDRFNVLDRVSDVRQPKKIFHGFNMDTVWQDYRFLTAVLIRAIYANLKYEVVEDAKNLRSLLVKLPDRKKPNDITFNRFKNMLEDFDIRYIDVLANIELYIDKEDKNGN